MDDPRTRRRSGDGQDVPQVDGVGEHADPHHEPESRESSEQGVGRRDQCHERQSRRDAHHLDGAGVEPDLRAVDGVGPHEQRGDEHEREPTGEVTRHQAVEVAGAEHQGEQGFLWSRNQ